MIFCERPHQSVQLNTFHLFADPVYYCLRPSSPFAGGPLFLILGSYTRLFACVQDCHVRDSGMEAFSCYTTAEEGQEHGVRPNASIL